MSTPATCVPRVPEAFFRRLLVATATAAVALVTWLPRAEAAAENTWLARFHRPLGAVMERQAAAEKQLRALGTPMAGQTAPQFGYLHPRLSAPPPTSPWVQVDLQSPHAIDLVSLIPAQVDWQSLDHPSHGFPRRFRIDVSNESNFRTFVTVGAHTETDFPDPRLAPVTFRVGAPPSRYVRLTVNKLAVEHDVHFFALAELMVISGGCNVAIGRPVRATGSWSRLPRWDSANLVDGRTALGPPLQHSPPFYDGLYAGPGEPSEPLFMELDLGRSYSVQEVRLHPIHRRLGSDIPGFSFPTKFRVELAGDPEFSDPVVLLDAAATNFPNPGNNVVTIRANHARGRYLKIVAVEPDLSELLERFGLSEVEVYADGANIARSAHVTSTPVRSPPNQQRPRELLVDGNASYGRIISLQDWLLLWQQRADLAAEIARLGGERIEQESKAQQRLKWAAATVGAIALAGAVVFSRYQRRRRTQEFERFRLRLARDLHDEIGSNLAGIAVISETAGETAAQENLPTEDWLEINRIARQTTDAMREAVWLIGARPESGIDLLKHLQLASVRMLPRHEVRWAQAGAELLPIDWPVEARREVFLFFKESLANIVRHSKSTEVAISARCDGKFLDLQIVDNGCGFQVDHETRGMGMQNLRERTRTLHATCELASQPGAGTKISLRVPVTAQKPRFPMLRSANFIR